MKIDKLTFYQFSKLIFIACILSTFGCQNDSISKVKNSVIDVDKSLTVGAAFDNYKYYDDVRWSESETSNGRTLVEVSSSYDYSDVTSDELNKITGGKSGGVDSIKDLSVAIEAFTPTFRFILNKDGSVQVMEMHVKGEMRGSDIEETYDDELLYSELRHIYNNQPSGFYLFGF
jgi:hypothetical protein